MTKTYLDFRNAIGFKESSNRYGVVNSLGYLGRYQFGTARLSDFGLCARVSGTQGFVNDDFEVKFTRAADSDVGCLRGRDEAIPAH